MSKQMVQFNAPISARLMLDPDVEVILPARHIFFVDLGTLMPVRKFAQLGLCHPCHISATTPEMMQVDIAMWVGKQVIDDAMAIEAQINKK